MNNSSMSLVPTDAQKRKRVKPKVLEEDEYLEKLESIIQRDFFPDISKLKAQNEYFDAVQRNDSAKIKQLQEKFSSRRTDVPINTPRSPEFFETPDIRRTDNDPLDKSNSEKVPLDDVQPSTSSKPVLPDNANSKDNVDTDNVTVDKFLYKFTSEDNSSFEQILDDSEEKLRRKHAWMYNAETEHAKRVASTLMLTTADEQQLAIEGRKGSSLDNWTYQAKNSVMFVPDGVEWSPGEMIDRQKLNQRVIIHENTRLDANFFGDQSTKQLSSKAATIQAAISKGKIDALGNEIGLSRLPGEMSFVVTPSPAPGVNESPMMTWGEIEGTPFRLDAGDTILPKTPGPSFKMPDIPVRDQLAECITTEMSKKHRQKKQAALNQISARTPSPFSGTKSVERISTMSPAAQRLATAKLGIRIGTDKALKATYTPSPARSGTSTTPSLLKTPSVYGADVVQSPVLVTPVKRTLEDELSTTESLTDNLLNLNAKKPKAADYF